MFGTLSHYSTGDIKFDLEQIATEAFMFLSICLWSNKLKTKVPKIPCLQGGFLRFHGSDSSRANLPIGIIVLPLTVAL